MIGIDLDHRRKVSMNFAIVWPDAPNAHHRNGCPIMHIVACTHRTCLLGVMLAFVVTAGCSSEKANQAMHETDAAAEPVIDDTEITNDDDATISDDDATISDDDATINDDTGPVGQDTAIQTDQDAVIDQQRDLSGAEESPSLSAAFPQTATQISKSPRISTPKSMSLQTMRSAREVSEPIFSEPMLAEPMLAESSAFSEPENAVAMEMAAPQRMSVEPAIETAAPQQIDTPSIDSTSTGPFTTLPAGASHDAEGGFATVAVYYATDRAKDSVPLSAYAITGNRDAFVLLSGSALAFLGFAGVNFWRRRSQVALAFSVFGGIASAGAAVLLVSGTTHLEKHGVAYNAGRGTLVTGIAQVTVPDIHQRGVIERPSLLRFEVRENQSEHIVLTSAIELSPSDFKQRLNETVALSPNQDILVFIHGYNVDFESAVQRTAQIAIDLPFEGVPVCYSWPSQAKLFGYTVDETNAAWTQTHLKQFLLELARESGARSINVVAHSMGNRPATGAMVELGWEQQQASTATSEAATPKKLFDRVVLAAPDVDADRFRRDLAPNLAKVADHVTLYASSDDQALVASKQVHGYPRAGESGDSIVVVEGIETVDVSGIDLSLLGHSYYGDTPSMLQDLYQLVRNHLPAEQRRQLSPRPYGELTYWQLINQPGARQRLSSESSAIR
ncbi:MAG: alpha/beta hydrolase [Planctomycetales bacterium]|nr:alpha/beta hydrolase [Planctomycetales bacterium]